MELTPQLLETQQFPEKWRGYDQDAVDEFLERVGVGLAELQDRLRTKSARLDELEGGDRPADLDDTTAERDISDELGGEADAPQKAVGERSVSEDSEVSAVARALVLAQKAADQALAEAESEGRRIAATAVASADLLTAEATADADRMLRAATVRHDAATSRLADVDSHIASLVEEALREARAEGSRLVSDAESRAKVLMGEAEMAAERVRKSETESAESLAKKAAADAEVAAQRKEAEALQVKIDERQTQLRSLIEGLQTLGDPGDPPAGPAVTEPAAPDEPVSGVTIDLTTDEPRVDHTAVEGGGQLRPLASFSSGGSSGPLRQSGSAATAPSTWASLEDPSPKVPHPAEVSPLCRLLRRTTSLTRCHRRRNNRWLPRSPPRQLSMTRRPTTTPAPPHRRTAQQLSTTRSSPHFAGRIGSSSTKTASPTSTRAASSAAATAGSNRPIPGGRWSGRGPRTPSCRLRGQFLRPT